MSFRMFFQSQSGKVDISELNLCFHCEPNNFGTQIDLDMITSNVVAQEIERERERHRQTDGQTDRTFPRMRMVTIHSNLSIALQQDLTLALIIYHVLHPCLLFSHINIIMQIMYIKGTT